jgi:hypothetical protein
MATSGNSLYKPDEDVRGKVFVFIDGRGLRRREETHGKVGCATNRSG